MASEFRFFDVMIFFVLIWYVSILCVFLCIRRTNVKKSIIERGINLEQPTFYDTALFSFELRTRFEDVTQSAWKGLKMVLCAFRFTMMVFFLGFAVILTSIQRQRGIFFFTNWNSLIVSFYFFAAFVSSVISLYYQFNRTEYDLRIGGVIIWSHKIQMLAAVVHMCFEISGASSLFSILFDTLFLDSDDLNVLMQAVGILAILALAMELVFSTIRVRFDQYPATIAYIMVYLLMMWPSVFTGIIPDWPYSVFRTDRQECLGYYSLLFVLHFACFCAWYGLYRIKKRVMIYFNLGRAGARYAEYFFDGGEDYDEDSPEMWNTAGRAMAVPYAGGTGVDRDRGYEIASATYPAGMASGGDQETSGSSSAIRPGIDPRSPYAPRAYGYNYDPEGAASTDVMFTDPNYFSDGTAAAAAGGSGGEGGGVGPGYYASGRPENPSFLTREPYADQYTEDDSTVHTGRSGGSTATGRSGLSAAGAALERARAKAAAGIALAPPAYSTASTLKPSGIADDSSPSGEAGVKAGEEVALKDSDFDLNVESMPPPVLDDDEMSMGSHYSFYSTGSYSYYGGMPGGGGGDSLPDIPFEKPGKHQAVDQTSINIQDIRLKQPQKAAAGPPLSASAGKGNIPKIPVDPSGPGSGGVNSDREVSLQKHGKHDSYYGTGYYEFDPDDPLGRGESRKVNKTAAAEPTTATTTTSTTSASAPSSVVPTTSSSVTPAGPGPAKSSSARTSSSIVASALARAASRRQQSSNSSSAMALQQLRPLHTTDSGKNLTAVTAAVVATLPSAAASVTATEAGSDLAGSGATFEPEPASSVDSGKSAGYPSSSGSFRLNEV